MNSIEVFWVAGDPPSGLAIVLRPRGGDWLEDEVARLKQSGIDTLVSMLEPDEAFELGLMEEEVAARLAGLTYISYPIPDRHIPADLTGFSAFAEGLAGRLRGGERIGIHCRGSIGRATVAGACALIHLGWKPKAALKAIEAARGCEVPDTEEQRIWILRYEAGLAAPAFDGSFQHNWTAEILPRRPMILPNRHFVYPGAAEEVEKGALEVLIQPGKPDGAEPFLATCALGFRDPAVPTGIWSCPHPDWICAVSGGYAYLIDVADPSQFTMIRYRPVLDLLCFGPAPESGQADSGGLLLFIGHHTILAWGRDGEAWESDRVSAEGVTELLIQKGILHGLGWDMRMDRELPFSLDLSTGRRI